MANYLCDLIYSSSRNKSTNFISINICIYYILRFYKFLLYLGIPSNTAREMKINYFLKIVSEFALEYRTTRERVIQQLEKKANHRERNKTRGKMITDVRL